MSETMSPLHTLAFVYFGQDFDVLAPDPDSVIRLYSTGRESELIDEIGRVMSEDPTEEDLKTLWLDTYRSCFEPDVRIGSDYTTWFEHMLDVLRRAT